MRLYKYSAEIVLREAELYLEGYSIPQIAKQLKMPNQTVSWHLIHPLQMIDQRTWVKVRKKLLDRAKDKYRRAYEEWLINSYEV